MLQSLCSLDGFEFNTALYINIFILIKILLVALVGRSTHDSLGVSNFDQGGKEINDCSVVPNPSRNPVMRESVYKKKTSKKMKMHQSKRRSKDSK